MLSDPATRAQYDIEHHRREKDRWRLVSTGAQAEDTFESERLARLTVLEVLYTRRKLEPRDPGIFDLDFESVLGQPREHLEFTFWYLLAKNFIKRGDQSRLMITPTAWTTSRTTTRPTSACVACCRQLNAGDSCHRVTLRSRLKDTWILRFKGFSSTLRHMLAASPPACRALPIRADPICVIGVISGS